MTSITRICLLSVCALCATLFATPREAHAVGTILTSAASSGKKTFSIRGGKKCRTLNPALCGGVSF
jgi:hypothetical protein